MIRDEIRTGYWKIRGFFSVYVNGRRVARVPTPEQAKEILREYE